MTGGSHLNSTYPYSIDNPIITMIGFEYWRGDGFMTKGHYRVNTLPERRNMIEDIAVILGGLDELQHPELGDIISFNLAMALESSGDFVKALSVYSDLITREAGNGVDLSLIIFRAAGWCFCCCYL